MPQKLEMAEKNRLTLKMVSLCLRYPDEEMISGLEGLVELLYERPEIGNGDTFRRFAAYVGCTPLLKLQENHTRTFDLDPSASLNLSSHMWKDDRRRATALAELNNAYHEAGVESATRELPDYLPLVLEFLSICSAAALTTIAGNYSGAVSKLAAHLKAVKSPYAEVLEVAEGALSLEQLEK